MQLRRLLLTAGLVAGLAAPTFSAPPTPAPPPASAQQVYQRALAAATAGDYGRATTLCRQALQLAPTAGPVWATLARLYADQGQLPEAITTVRKAIALAPQRPEFQADLADYLFRAGKPEALAAAKQALARAPKDDVALSTVASVYMRARHYDDAIPVLRRLQVVRGGKDRAVAQNIVFAYVQKRDLKGALAASQDYATKAKTDIGAWKSVADFGMKTGNRAAVTLAAAKLDLLEPKSAEPYYFRGQSLLADNALPLPERLKRAEVQFQKGVAKAPQVAIMRSQLGITQLFQGSRRFEMARKNLIAALVLDNHDAVARRGLALLAEQDEKWDDAIVHYDALTKITPNDSKSRRRYAGVLIKAGRKDDAYAQFRELATRNPADTTYLKELASFLLEDKRYAEARSAYAAVLERAPDDADGQLGVARCFAEEGKKEEALAAYERAIAAGPKSETPYLLLAQMYIDDKNPIKATELLERLLQVVPNSNAGRWMLIQEYTDAKRDDDARREIAKLTLHRGDQNRDLYRLAAGNLLMAREKYAEAATEFERIVGEEPENPEALLALASAYAKLGRKDDAAKEYEAAAKQAESSLARNGKNTEMRSVLTRARGGQGKPEAATAFLKELDESAKNDGR